MQVVGLSEKAVQRLFDDPCIDTGPHKVFDGRNHSSLVSDFRDYFYLSKDFLIL